ncbi:LruC domain-containing protein [Candidatus Sumerlaeota bacterium]|nr:LruC domain-containing protein [Candidatus Sumerlaeota bacterium]
MNLTRKSGVGRILAFLGVLAFFIGAAAPATAQDTGQRFRDSGGTAVGAFYDNGDLVLLGDLTTGCLTIECAPGIERWVLSDAYGTTLALMELADDALTTLCGNLTIRGEFSHTSTTLTPPEDAIWTLRDDEGAAYATIDSDGNLTIKDQLRTHVQAVEYSPPLVEASVDVSPLIYTQTANLGGTVTPNWPTTYTVLWTLDSKPTGATVEFGSPTSPTTTVDFSMGGEYVLRLTADDGISTEGTDTVNVSVTNATPYFLADPFYAANARVGQSHSDSIAGSAADSDPSETLTYSKDSGPGWLTVETSGTLSSVAGPTEDGLASFTVRVTDGGGEFSTATLRITVLPEGGWSVVDATLAHWKMDDNAASPVVVDAFDDRDSTFTSTSSTPHTSEHTTTGVIDSALWFDGVDDHVDCGTGWFETDTFAMSFWLRLDQSQTNGCVVSKLPGDLDGGFAVNVDLTRRLLLRAYESGQATSKVTVSPSPLAVTEWCFVAIQKNDAGEVETYFNGGNKQTSSADFSFSNAASLTLGKGPSCLTTPVGSIDDVRIFSRYLTEEEVEGLYNDGEGNDADENFPPIFTSDPLNAEPATEDEPYSDSIWGTATDRDGDILTYSLVSGPSWLTVSGGGGLSGLPLRSDAGMNEFTVRVDDGYGGSDTATLLIHVCPAVSFFSPSYSANESDGTAELLVVLPEAVDGGVLVTYQILTSSTAVAGQDYVTPSPQEIQFESGQTTCSLTIELTDDSDDEAPETIVVELTGATGATLGAICRAVCTIVDDDPISLAVSTGMEIDEGSLVRLSIDLLNPGSVANSYGFETTADPVIADISDAASTVPLYRDVFPVFDALHQDFESSATVEVTNGYPDDTATTHVCLTVRRRDLAELGAIVNINGPSGADGAIEVGCRPTSGGLAVAGSGTGRTIVWSTQDAVGNLALYELTRGVRSLVAADERVLGVAQDGDEQSLLTRDADGDVWARTKTLSERWESATPEEVGSSAAAAPSNASIMRYGEAWYAVFYTNTTQFRVYVRNGATWSGSGDALSGATPDLILGADDNLYLSYINSGKDFCVRCREGSSAWSDPPFYTSSGPDFESSKGVADGDGNIWGLLLKDGSTSITVLMMPYDSANQEYGAAFSEVTGDLLAGEGVVAVETPNFAAAGDNAYVYLQTLTPEGMRIHRCEAFTTPSLSIVTTSSLALSYRDVFGEQGSRGQIFGHDGTDPFATWHPALVDDSNQTYLVGREFKDFIRLDRGRHFALRQEVRADLGISGPAGVEVRLYGDLQGVRVGAETIDVGEWFDYPANQRVWVTLNDDPHGYLGDVGKQTVYAQFRDTDEGNRSPWIVKDSVVYVNEYDWSVVSIEIADEAGVAIPDGVVIELDSGETYDFQAIIDYLPDDFDLDVDETQIEWAVTNGIGTIEDGHFLAGLKGSGKVVASREADNVDDWVFVHVVGAGPLDHFDIYPQEPIVLGLDSQQRFTAVGRDAAGNPVPCQIGWRVDGPGQILQNGLYLSPHAAAAPRATIVAFDIANPEIQSLKDIVIDGRAPDVVGLTIDGQGPSAPVITVEGSTDVRWSLSQNPQEDSGPVEFVAVVDDRLEIGRFTASDVTASSYTLSSWNTATVPDGRHTVKILATDSVGNSNSGRAPSLTFWVDNVPSGTRPTGALSGIDWLLEHQWRNDDEDFGSWKTQEDRSRAELIAEATFAANALVGADLAYESPYDNVYSESPVSVAQAYHDAIVWLAGEMEQGEVGDFGLRSSVIETLAYANRAERKVLYCLGGIDPLYKNCGSWVAGFMNDDQPSLMDYCEGAEGSFSLGGESLSTRYETILALRASMAAGAGDALGVLSPRWLEYFGENTGFVQQVLTSQSNEGGWSNARLGISMGQNTIVPYPSDVTYPIAGSLGNTWQLDNFYLTAEIASTINALRRQSGYSHVYTLVENTPLRSFFENQTATIDPNSIAFPQTDPNVVDTAAGVWSLVNMAMTTSDSNLCGSLGAKALKGANYLIAQQSTDDGGWNARALDTAWAVRALRPELGIALPAEGAFAPVSRQFNVLVKNYGPAAALNARVSAFDVDPRDLTPSERTEERLVSSAAYLVASSDEVAFELTLPEGRIPKVVYFMIDAEERIPEFDEDNNVVEWTMPKRPNLVVCADGIRAYSSSGPPIAGATWYLEARVWNLGQQAVTNPEARVRLFEGHPLEAADPRYLRYVPLGTGSSNESALNPGCSKLIAFEVHSNRLDLQTPGDYDLFVWADAPWDGFLFDAGKVAESCETDNIAGRRISVYEPGALEWPDLAVSADGVDYGPKPLFYEEPGYLRVRLDNVGAGDAFDVDLRVSLDDLLSSRTVRVAELKAGHSKTIEMSLVLEEASSYTIRVEADPDDRIREMDDENNVCNLGVIVHPHDEVSTPDLGIYREDISISDLGDGKSVQGTIRNLLDEIDEALGHKLNYHIDYTNLDDTYYNSGDIIPFGLPRHGSCQAVDPETDRLDSAPSVVNVSVRFDFLDSGEVAVDEYSAANNEASRSFNIDKTNLRILDISADPEEPIVASCETTTAPVNVTVVLANGQDEEGFVDASGVHLRIVDEITGKELDYWTNLTLPALETDSEGVTVGIVTLTLRDVPLAIGLHSIKATVDPIGFFVETDETDNEMSVSVEVVDNGAGTRPTPNLSISESDIRFANTDSLLVVNAVIHYEKPSGEGVPAPVFRVPVFVYEKDDLATTISCRPFIIPVIEAGEQFEVTIPTTLSLESVSDAEGVCVYIDPRHTIGEDEADWGDNGASRVAARPTAPADLSVTALPTKNLAEWSTASDEPVDVIGYLLTRSVGTTETTPVDAAWSVARGVTSYLDGDIDAGTTYTYCVRSIGENGRYSFPVGDTAVSDPPLLITQIDGYDLQTSWYVTTQSAITVLGTFGSDATYSDEPITLYLNNVAHSPTATPNSQGVFTFSNVSLEDQTRFVLVAWVSRTVEGKTYWVKSNQVIVLYDKFPDLRFILDSDNEPEISMQWWADNLGTLGAWESAGDLSTVGHYAGRKVKFEANIENCRQTNIDTGFNVLFSVEYENETFQNRITQATLNGTQKWLATHDPITLRSDSPVKAVRFKVDYAENQKGEETPYGQIVEYSEVNNNYRVLASGSLMKENIFIDTEFWMPIPFYFSKMTGWGYSCGLTIDNDFGVDARITVTAGEADASEPQTVRFENFRSGELVDWNWHEVVRVPAGASGSKYDDLWVLGSAPEHEHPATLTLPDPVTGRGVGEWMIPNKAGSYWLWESVHAVLPGAEPQWKMPKEIYEVWEDPAFHYEVLHRRKQYHLLLPESHFQCKPDYKVDDVALRITSDEPFSAVCWTKQTGNGSAFSVIPKRCLGKKYVVGGYDGGWFGCGNYTSNGQNMTFFQILAVEDGLTTVGIYQNALGVPDYDLFNQFGGTEAEYCGTEGGRKVYCVELDKGQTYVWSSNRYLGGDPGGILLVANKRIAVLAGGAGDAPVYSYSQPEDVYGSEVSCVMLPPIPEEDEYEDSPDMHFLPKVAFNSSATRFYPWDTAYLPENADGKCLNHIIRVVPMNPTPNALTYINLMNDDPGFGVTIPVLPGGWLEIGEDSRAFIKILDDDLPLLTEYVNGKDAGNNYFVQRVVDNDVFNHRIWADNNIPLLVQTAFFTNIGCCDSLNPGLGDVLMRWESYETPGHPLDVNIASTYPDFRATIGDPDIALDIPVREWVRDEMVQFTLMTGPYSYSAEVWSKGTWIRDEKLDSPYQVVDVYTSTTAESPRLFGSLDAKVGSPKYPVDSLTQQVGYWWWGSPKCASLTTGWWDASGIPAPIAPSPTVKACRFFLPIGPNSQRDFYLYNPDRLPVCVRVSGFADYASYYYPACRYVKSVVDEKSNYKDLALEEGSIGFPYNGDKLLAGQPVIAQVEAMNNGNQDVTTTSGAQLVVTEIAQSGTRVLITTETLPLAGEVVPARRLYSYVRQFSYTPSSDVTGITATLSYPGDQDPTNDSYTRSLSVEDIVYPDISVVAGSLTVEPASASPRLAGDPVRVSATVRCTGFLVEEIPVWLQINAYKPEPVDDWFSFEAQYTTVTLTPDTIVNPAPGAFCAETTVEFEWEPGGEYELHSGLVCANYYSSSHYPDPPHRAVDEGPDASIFTPSSPYWNNLQRFKYVDNVRFGNLSIANPSSDPPNPVVSGQSVDLSGVVSNDDARPFENAEVGYYYGDPRTTGTARLARRAVDLSKNALTTVTAPVTIWEIGTHTIYIGIDPTNVFDEDDEDDNWTSLTIEVIEALSPDLSVRPDSDYACTPTQAVRGTEVDLGAWVRNVGYADATVPYKAAIFEGSSDPTEGTVLAEAVLNWPPGTDQHTSETRTLAGAWDTSDAALGRHDLFLVIDSPNHLAASAHGDAPFKEPLRADLMQGDTGIRVPSFTGVGQVLQWQLDVYATTDTLCDASQKIGHWDPAGGFCNTDVNTSGMATVWRAAASESVLLVFTSADGETFPTFSEPWDLKLAFRDEFTTGLSVTTSVDVALPANAADEWGTTLTLWLAADGSTYFTRRYHLAGDYMNDSIVSDLISAGLAPDMVSTETMRDESGCVDELSEMNNIFPREVSVYEETWPNLTVSVETPSTSSLVGRIIPIHVDVTNDGADLTTATEVALTYEPEDSSQAPVAICETLIVPGPILHGQSVAVVPEVEWEPGSLTGEYRILAEVDPADKIPESCETDNMSSTTILIEGTTTLTLETITPTLYCVDGPSTVPIAATVESCETGMATLLLSIETADGVATSTVSSIDLATSTPFSMSGTHTFDVIWPIGTNPAGDYRVRAELYRIVDSAQEEPPLPTLSNPFEIAPDKSFSCGFMAPPPQAHYAKGPIAFEFWLGNDSVNWTLPGYDYTLEVENSLGQKVWCPASASGGPLHPDGAVRTHDERWESPSALGNPLTATVKFYEVGESEPSAQAQTTFTFGERETVGVAVDILSSALEDIVYTSSTVVSVTVDAVGSDVTTNGLMMLSDERLAGPGVLTWNYMPNAGFEDASSSDPDVPAFWSDSQTSSVTLLALTTETVHLGQTALAITGTYNGWAEPEDIVEVPLDSQLAVSFYGRVESADDAIALSVREYDTEGYLVRESLAPVACQSTDCWSRIECVVVTSGTVGVRPRLTLIGSGEMTAYVDSLQIQEGAVATAWIDSSGYAQPGRFVNLLANPSLTLDDGTTWSLLHEALAVDSDVTAGNDVPDGWHLSGTADADIVASQSLPSVLAERGLSDAFTLSSSSGPKSFALSQSLISGRPSEALVLSVYAGGTSETLEAIVRQYDDTETEIGDAVTSQTFELSGTLARYSLDVTTTSGAKTVGVEFSGSVENAILLVAAQLEPGSIASRWVGWAKYCGTVENWSVKETDTDGEKRVEAQILSKLPFGLAVRPSADLTPDDLGFETTADGLIVEALLPGRPVVTDVAATFSSSLDEETTLTLEGAFEPGDWTVITTSTLDLDAQGNATHLISGLDSQYAKYRLVVHQPGATRSLVSACEFSGFELSGRDNVVFDATQPEGEISVPNEGSVLSGTEADIEIAATDNVSGLREAAYGVWQNSVQVSSATLSAWEDGVVQGTFDISVLDDGAASITATVVDRAGNVGNVPVRGVTIDRTPPVLSDARIDNDTTANDDWAKSGDTVTLRVEVDDDSVTASGVFANLEAFGLATAATPDSYQGDVFEWDLSDSIETTSDGLVSAVLWARDPYGNTSGETVVGTTVDNTPPQLSLVPVSPDPHGEQDVTLEGEAEDNPEGEIADVWYKLDAGDWLPTSATLAPFDSYSEPFEFALTGLSDTVHTVYTKCVDAAGNESEIVQDTFEIDYVLPEIEVSVANLDNAGASLVKDGDLVRVRASFNVIEVNAESASADLTALGGAANTKPLTTTTEDDTTTLTWFLNTQCTPADGWLTTTVHALDRLDRPVSGSDSILADNSLPTSTLTPQSPDPVSTNSVTLYGTASDVEPGRIASIEYRLDGEGWTTASLTSPPYGDATTETFSVVLQELDDGEHTVQVRAWDTALNVPQDGYSSDTFTVDTNVPLIASLSAYNLTTTQSLYVKNGDNVEITALFDPGRLEPEDTVTANLSGLGKGTSVEPTTRTATSALWYAADVETSPANGEVVLTVNTLDAAGNSDCTSVSLLADNTPPASTIENYGPNPTSSTLPALGGLATDSTPGIVSNVEVQVDGSGPWYPAIARDAGLFTGGFDSAEEYWDMSVSLTDGTYTIYVRATDRAGNVEPGPYENVEITIDRSGLTEIASARLLNPKLHSVDPEMDPQVFRTGHPLTLVANLQITSGSLPTTSTIHADLTSFTLGSDVCPDGVVGETAYWDFPTTGCTALSGEILTASVWTDIAPTTQTYAAIVLDDTSPTLTVDPLFPYPPCTRSVVITGTAQDEEPTSVGAKVQGVWYRVDGGIVGTEDPFDPESTPTLNTSFWPAEPVDGAFDSSSEAYRLRTYELADLTTHTIEVIARDLVGNVRRTTETFYIDTTTPMIHEATISDLDVPASVTTTYVSNGHSVVVEALLNYPFLLTSQLHADLRGLGGTSDTLASSFFDKQALWPIEDIVTSPTDGQVEVAVWLTIDGETTGTVFAQTTADNASPVLHSVSFPPDAVATNTLVIEGIAHDRSGSGVDVLLVSLDDGDNWTTVTQVTSTTLQGIPTAVEFEYTASGLDDGVYPVRILARDRVGLESSQSTRTVTVDTCVPTVSLDAYAPDPVANDALTYTGSAEDGSGSDYPTVYYAVDQADSWTTVTQTTPGSGTNMTFSFNLTNLGSTTHTIWAKALDQAGNESALSSDTVTVDAVAPQIVIFEPESDATLSDVFDIAVQVTDNLVGVTSGSVRYQFVQDGQAWTAIPRTWGNPTSGTYTIDNIDGWRLEQGPEVLSVRASDGLGNNENTSATDQNPAIVDVTVDYDYPPQAPTGMVAGYTSYEDVEIRWNKNDEASFSYYELHRQQGSGGPILSPCLYQTGIEQGTGSPFYNYYVDQVSSDTATPYSWRYALRSVDLADNVSTFSQTVSVPPPDAPWDLRAIAESATTVTLTWHLVTDSFVAGYKVIRTIDGASTTTVSIDIDDLTTVTPTTAQYKDASVASETQYTYHVVAYDGADNVSLDSNHVTATPSVNGRTIEDVHTVVFEDQEGVATCDYDCNDLVILLESTIYLDSSDNVSSIVVTTTGKEKNGTYSIAFNLDLVGLMGSANVNVTRYDSQTPTVPRSWYNGTYSSGGATIPVFPNTTNGVYGTNGIEDDVAVVTILLNSPESNPWMQSNEVVFDEPPFDAWIAVNSTDEETHIFDPENLDYFMEGQVVQIEDTPLTGIYIPLGFKMPVLTWTTPPGTTRLWDAYPDFVEWAKSVRSLGEVKNASWYTHYVPPPGQ